MLDVAVVGLGWWGKVIVGHLRGHAALRVAAGVDVDTAGLAAFARAEGFPLHARLEDALAESRIEAVVLCTPHSQHAAQIAACARRTPKPRKAGHSPSARAAAETREFAAAPAVLANLEAFARAAAGDAPYPVPQEQMIANIAALEAIVRSTRSGPVEPVES